MALVIFDKGAELVVLEIAFAVALCLRYCAAMAERVIRRSINEVRAIGVMARIEGRKIQRRIAGIEYVTTVTTRRRSSESQQASFSALGLPHLGLTARMLPQPVLIVRQ